MNVEAVTIGGILAVISNEYKAVQPEKTSLSIVSIELPNLIVRSFEQFLNTLEPIEVTLLGIEIEVSDEQEENASVQI